MLIFLQENISSEGYTLPEGMQLAVAIATIISSFAVIIYIVQLIVTIKTFNKQTAINQSNFDKQLEHSTKQLKDQLEFSLEQFTSAQQGYLLFEPKVFLLDQVRSVCQLISDNQNVTALQIGARYKNVGKTPIITSIKYANIYIRDGLYKMFTYDDTNKSPIYPDQENSVNLCEIDLKPYGSISTFDVLNAMKVTVDIYIEYHDFNNARIKTVNRRILLLFEDNIISYKTININDSV